MGEGEEEAKVNVAEQSTVEVKAAQARLISALEDLAGRRMPRPKHTKLLNWRTSQVSPPLSGNESVVTAAGGRLVFTGDWC